MTIGLSSGACLKTPEREKFREGYGPDDFRFVVDAFDKGHADPRAIVSSTIALDELPGMFGRLRENDDETKVHVQMN